MERILVRRGIAIGMSPKMWYKNSGGSERGYFREPGEVPRQFLLWGPIERAGVIGPVSKYYLITLVFHDQSADIGSHLSKYRRVLSDCGMMGIAFHLSPLMNGHREYADLSLGDRKRHLSKFLVFVQNLPFAYQTFAFRKMEFDGTDKLLIRMKRDITSFFSITLDSSKRSIKSKCITTTASRLSVK